MTSTIFTSNGIDQKIVAASILSFLKTSKDFATIYGRSDFVADVNAKHTSTAVIRLAPVVTLADVDADRTGLMARTAATSSSVEVTLTADKYFKIAIDDLNVEPEKAAADIGAAGALAIAKAGNANFLAGCVAQGTNQYLGEVFGSGTTSAEIWTALNALHLPFAVAEYTENNVLFIAPHVWARLLQSATLQTAVDPRVQAATLLGYKAVEVTPITGALAVELHGDCAAQARRLVGVQGTQEDFDSIVEGRVKLGTKVLVAAGVQTLLDGVSA